MTQAFPPYVVVGIDSSPGAERALQWAADDADRRGAPLRIGYAWSLVGYRLPPVDYGDPLASARKAAEELLASAAKRVTRRFPELDVTTALLPDEPAVSLLAASEHAQLLVVGARGVNRFTALLLGSVSQTLAAHATCPVAVVPAAVTGEGLAEAGPVVLGVAPDEVPGPVEFAFAEARLRGVPVRAVRTWRYPQTFPGEAVVPPQEEAEINRRESEELEGVLAAARTSFPAVPVVTEVVLNEPEAALVEASREACLVVVGARRRRGRHALPLGKVTQRVLHHARCPVVVVPV
jgi:nucleotide-binding universal stress UspA family protein